MGDDSFEMTVTANEWLALCEQRDRAVELLRALYEYWEDSVAEHRGKGPDPSICEETAAFLSTLDAPRKREAMRNLTRLTEEAGGYEREEET